jgi:hypothetical protein
MKKIGLLQVIYFLPILALAQPDKNKSAIDLSQQFASTITAQDLKTHLTIVASKEMEGRETGTQGQRNAAQYIKKQFESFGLLPAPGTENYLQYFPLPYVDSAKLKKGLVNSNACNVVGLIEGSDKKDEYVFITGHYDHLGMRNDKIYYGADDDGSGTCAVIEIAEAFAKAKAAGHGPRRTIVCMTVSGEEKGLWGSDYYSEHPLFPLEKTSVDLNIDMVGRKDPNRKKGDNNNYVYVIGHDKLSSELPIINESVNNQFTKLEFDYKYDDPNDNERIFYRSDHYNFAKKGVPILFFFDGIHEDYHKTSDTVDKINFDLYEKRIQMVFHTAWEIANREELLKRDIPLPLE